MPPPPPAEAPEGYSVDLRRVKRTFTRGYEIAAGTSWEASFGLKLDTIGIGAEVGWSETYESSVSLSYELSGGKRYVSRAVPDLPVPMWTIEQ